MRRSLTAAPWRRVGALACAGALLAAAAGCGGGGDSSSAALPSAKEVTRCLVAAGAAPNGLQPTKPKGFPASGVEAVTIRGVDNDDMVIYLSRKPVFTDRIANGFTAYGEFHGEALLDGHVLLLYLPKYFTQRERSLALGCLT